MLRLRLYLFILLFVLIGIRWWFSRTALKRNLLSLLVVVHNELSAHRCAHLNSFGKLNERKENFLFLPFCVFFHFSHSLDFPRNSTTSLLIWLSLNMSVHSFSRQAFHTSRDLQKFKFTSLHQQQKIFFFFFVNFKLCEWFKGFSNP